jgi:hypothetical protein
LKLTPLLMSPCLCLLACAWSAHGWAQAPAVPVDPAGAESAEAHARTGIQARAATPAAVAPARDGPRDAALQKIETRLACTCYENGALHVDVDKALTAAACPCAEAVRVRADVEQSLASVSTPELADKRKVAEILESTFVPLRAEYERVFRYPRTDYEWFMNNVRCVCDGCKPTIFFSKCQLSCTPGIVYKLRAKVFLALGFSRDELLDYYRDEYNAAHSAREQITREWLLPGRQREQGWLVPAMALSGAGVLLLGLLRRWVRVGRGADGPVPAGGPLPPEALSDEARARVRRALDRDEDLD